LKASFLEGVLVNSLFCKENRSRSYEVKCLSYPHPRESVPRQTTRESSSRMKKRKKKNNNNNSWLFILSRLFRRALFFLSFFPSDVSTLAFLHFFNRNAKRVFVSLFPSIQ
jgi:hypothetical protein